MPKALTAFVCQQCESQYPQSYGRCPSCGAWGSLTETIQTTGQSGAAIRSLPRSNGALSVARPLAAVESRHDHRLDVGFVELNRVLGGGIVPGSAVLLGGDPGVGKSTLLLQVAASVSERGPPVLYATGEESPEQLRLRADRLGAIPPALSVLAESDVDAIISAADQPTPSTLIVDSIQTMRTDDLESAPGSVAQVKECASRLVRFAKEQGCAVFLVGHVTKEGSLAGPKVLEHMVDVVLYLEGDHFQAYRILRSLKNRFGSSHEIAVFDMREDGMREISNLSGLFLASHSGVSSGSAVTVAMEGTRPIPVEVQALAARTAFGLPRRSSTGIDINRLHMLTAVLGKRAGLDLGSHDIYVNIVGGLRVDEPAVDLATVLAIYSSHRDIEIPRCAVLGEVGLGGEVRPVSQLRRRLAEARKLGISTAVIPAAGELETDDLTSMDIRRVDTVTDALKSVGKD